MTARKPILVLGSSGRVGRALRAVWPADVPVIWQQRGAGDGVLVWDLLAAPVPVLPPLAGVIGLAGATAGPGLDQTVDLARRTVAAAAGARVLLASSQAVYGPQTGAVTEAAPPAPVSDYGRAKWAMEQALVGQDGVTALRIGNVAGCDGLARAMAAGPVTLDQFADDTGPRRMMIGPQTLAQTLIGLLQSPARLPGVLNVAQPGLVAMADILRAAGADWQWRAAGAGALAVLAMDVTRLAGLVDLPGADAAGLVAQARQAGAMP